MNERLQDEQTRENETREVTKEVVAPNLKTIESLGAAAIVDSRGRLTTKSNRILFGS